nr:MAG TPA: hypothetical protein [Caudoviricetes sp.]
MAKVELQIKGREALQKRLNEKRQQIISYLNMRLMQLAEEAVTYSKENKGYQDRTANLKNSISFALYLDWQLITSAVGKIPKEEEAEEGQEGVSAALNEYAQKEGVVAPKGYSLVIVAGMNYGKYVEDKGYNVLHLTKYFLRDEMKKIFEEVAEMIKSDS